MAFLTEIDPQVAIRGSRDPLSLVPIWSAFGRRVVGNLTTASSSLRGFTTLLLGYYCAGRLRERAPESSALNIFLRVEQLVSYSRLFHNGLDSDFRGIDRVRKRLGDSSRVVLSAEPHFQTLGDQKTYGLWGLYSVAARTSGLLLPDRPSLTPEAAEFVEQNYIHALARAGLHGDRTLLSAVAPDRKDLDLRRGAQDLSAVLATIHQPSLTDAEQRFYREFLVDGGREQNTGGLQRTLASLLERVQADKFGMSDFLRVLRLAERVGHSDLAARLESIRRVELLIVAAATLFGFLLRSDSRSLDAISTDTRETWGKGLRFLRPIVDATEREIALIADDGDVAAHLGRFGRCAADGEWPDAIRELMAFNALVMKRRGGAPWVRESGGQLRVDYREEGRDLLPPVEIEGAWANTYFINSLHGITRSVTSHIWRNNLEVESLETIFRDGLKRFDEIAAPRNQPNRQTPA